jgi:hypothetical protein
MPDQEREASEFSFGDRKIDLYRPTDGQMLIVLQVVDIMEEEVLQQQIELVTNFGVVIRSLFVNDEDRQAVHRGLASGKNDLEDYMNLAVEIIQQFAPDQASNREERRAASKAPPAKRAVRKAATRG